MPILKDATGAEAPTKPHLGVLTDESGEVMAIPPGATIFIITDPTKANGVIPLTLLRASLNLLEFSCACRQPGCTARYTFKASRRGHHPYKR